MKLYAAIANALNALQRTNTMPEIRARHVERLEALIDALPHGSGFDVRARPEPLGDCNARNQYLIHGSYHKMDENGSYAGWYDFTIRVFAKEDLCFPWDIEMLSLEEELDEYILATYSEALYQEEPR